MNAPSVPAHLEPAEPLADEVLRFLSRPPTVTDSVQAAAARTLADLLADVTDLVAGSVVEPGAHRLAVIASAGRSSGDDITGQDVVRAAAHSDGVVTAGRCCAVPLRGDEASGVPDRVLLLWTAEDGVPDLARAERTLVLLGRRVSLVLTLASERRMVGTLREALASNREIGAALGIVMATHRVTQQQAFDLLRGISQDHNRKLRDIATEVLFTGALPTS